MQCYIYKSLKKADLYLYINTKDDFSQLPAECMEALGTLEFVMDLELTPTRKLARENPEKVMRSLNEKGFFIQLPPIVVAANQTLQ